MKTMTTKTVWSAFVVLVGALAVQGALASTTIYYHNDLAGSPIAATNQSGQVIWRESYRPYGERLTNSAASKDNDVWFTSRRQDAETGFVYMGARYYDPVVGRFISTDPKGFDEANVHSFNRYAYANNNPYRYTDPDGRDAVDNARKSISDWWGNSVAAFKSEGPGDAAMRALSALPAEAGAVGLLGAMRAATAEAQLAAKAEDVTYKIIDGVRRSKAAELSGNATIRAEIEGIGGKIVNLPIDALLSPKEVIETAGAGAKRWTSVLEGTRGGADLPPILVRPGSVGIPIKDVKVQ